MQVKGISTDIKKPFDFGPEIIKVEAQLEFFPQSLKITAEFSNLDVDFRVSVMFVHIEGFRVLDEGDLINYWNQENLPEEWIWEIIKDGWYSEERRNDNATTLSTRFDELTEYLVTGVGFCVSVICGNDSPPIIELID